MNTPVSFPLAKLLNSKGLPGLKSFYSNKKQYVLNPKKYTIGDVVMWLYKKHGIWIEVGKLDGFQDLFFYTITGSKGFNKGFNITVVEWDDDKCDEMGYNNKYKDTPEEAYEAAIEYVLKNLI